MIDKKVRKAVEKLSKRKYEMVIHHGFDVNFIENHIIEEMAELIQAINKVRRTNGQDSKRIDNLHEEIADVYVGLHEIIALNDIDRIQDKIISKVKSKKSFLEKWADKNMK